MDWTPKQSPNMSQDQMVARSQLNPEEVAIPTHLKELIKIPQTPSPQEKINHNQQVYMMITNQEQQLNNKKQMINQVVNNPITDTSILKEPNNQILHIQKNFKIATQNTAGFNNVKFQKIISIIVQHEVAIMIITEVKQWQPQYTKQLENLNCAVIVENQYDDHPRGGVVTILDLTKCRYSVISKNYNTSTTLKIKVNNAVDGQQKSHRFTLMSVYINPLPNDREKVAIKETTKLIAAMNKLSNQPAILIGDFNANGKRMMQKTKNTMPQLIQETTRQRRGNQNSIIDQCYIRNVTNGKLEYYDYQISDHKLIIVPLMQIVLEAPSSIYTKATITNVMQDQEILEAFTFNAYPILDTEKLIQSVAKKTELHNIVMSKIKEKGYLDKTNEEVDQILREYIDESQEEMQAKIDQIERSQDPMLLFSIIKELKAKQGDTAKLVKYWKQNDQILTQTQSNKVITEEMNAKFNKLQGYIPTPILNPYFTTESQIYDLHTEQEKTHRQQDLQKVAASVKCEIFQEIKQTFTPEESKAQQDLEIAIYESFKHFSLDKAHGNDLIQMSIRNSVLKTTICQCQACQRQLTELKSLHYLENNQVELVKPINKCPRNQNPIQVFVSMRKILAFRLSVMVVAKQVPLRMYNCRLTMLSKNGSNAVDSIKMIRPIGILSIMWKVIEKAFKIILDKEAPQVLQTGQEQAGFTKDRSTLDHTTMLLQRIHNASYLINKYEKRPLFNESYKAQYQQRLFMFCDISGAYDNVKHSKLFQILTQSFSKWDNELSRIMLQNIIDSYKHASMSIGSAMIKITQGVTQGSVLAPQFFKLYIQEMIKSDEILLQKKRAYQKLIKTWKDTKSFDDKLLQMLMEPIMLMYADDIIIEFKSIDELKNWDKLRQNTWNEFNMTLNPTKTIVQTFKKIKEDRVAYDEQGKKLKYRIIRTEINTGLNIYKIVDKTQYLGLTVQPRDKALGPVTKLKANQNQPKNTIKQDQQLNSSDTIKKLKAKIIKITSLIRFCKTQFNKRVEQSYAQAIYRYYMTPYVITGLIKVEDALLTWNQQLRKLYKVPTRISNIMMPQIIPSTNWLEWWSIQLIKMNEKQPMFLYKETLDTMKNTIKQAGVTTKPIRDFQEQASTKQLMIRNREAKISDEQYITKDHYNSQFLKTPELRCAICFEIESIDITQYVQSSLQYPLDSENSIYFTDASSLKDHQGNNYAGVGIFQPKDLQMTPKFMFSAPIVWQKTQKNQQLINNVIAEALAVEEAIRHVIRSKEKSAIIFTDSQVTLDAISKWSEEKFNKHDQSSPLFKSIICSIQHLIRKADDNNIKIKTFKVRAHSANRDWITLGNHLADYLADLSTTGRNNAPKIKTCPINHQDDNPLHACTTCRIKWISMSDNQKIEIAKATKRQLQQLKQMVYLDSTEPQNEWKSKSQSQQIFKTPYTRHMSRKSDDEVELIILKQKLNINLVSDKTPNISKHKLETSRLSTFLTDMSNLSYDGSVIQNNQQNLFEMVQDMQNPPAAGIKVQQSSNRIRDTPLIKQKMSLLQIIQYQAEQEHLENLTSTNVNLIYQKHVKRTQAFLAKSSKLTESQIKHKMSQQFNRINWDASTGTINDIITDITLRAKRDPILKSLQWTKLKSKRVLNSYINHIQVIISALLMAKGYFRQGEIHCAKCSTKTTTTLATIDHIQQCYNPVSDIKHFDQYSILQLLEFLNYGPIRENQNSQSRQIEIISKLHKAIRLNHITPYITAHLAALITWAQQTCQLYKQLLTQQTISTKMYSQIKDDSNTRNNDKNKQTAPPQHPITPLPLPHPSLQIHSLFKNGQPLSSTTNNIHQKLQDEEDHKRLIKAQTLYLMPKHVKMSKSLNQQHIKVSAIRYQQQIYVPSVTQEPDDAYFSLSTFQLNIPIEVKEKESYTRRYHNKKDSLTSLNDFSGYQLDKLHFKYNNPTDYCNQSQKLIEWQSLDEDQQQSNLLRLRKATKILHSHMLIQQDSLDDRSKFVNFLIHDQSKRRVDLTNIRLAKLNNPNTINPDTDMPILTPNSQPMKKRKLADTSISIINIPNLRRQINSPKQSLNSDLITIHQQHSKYQT